MRNLLTCEFVQLFRLRNILVLGIVGASILASVGLSEAAVGLVIGLALFVLKSFFLYEAGRALIKRDSKGIGRAIAALSSLGRVVFLAVALALVAQMGLSALLSACGGLVLGQLNLHLSYIVRRKPTQCSNT